MTVESGLMLLVCTEPAACNCVPCIHTAIGTGPGKEPGSPRKVGVYDLELVESDLESVTNQDISLPSPLHNP